MNGLFRPISAIYVGCLVIILMDLLEASDSSVVLRQKRFLSFPNTTKFFMRLNTKNNMVAWTQIFAEAIGFRMNWNEPPDTFHPYHRLYRRSVYNNLEILLNRHGFDGYNCIRRAICEVGRVKQPRGIYHNVLKMIFRQQSNNTERWHNMTSQDCVTSLYSCKFSLLDISLYTDE